MWVRKDLERFERDHEEARSKSRSPLIPFLWALGVFLLSSLNVLVGRASDFGSCRGPLPLEKFFSQHLGTLLLYALGGFLLAYAWQWFSGRELSPLGTSGKTVLCPCCGEAKQPDGITDCACGGEFVPLEALQWVDDPAPKDGDDARR
jgi:hypothetical protein